MPQPTRQELHVNQLLTNISVATIQDEKAFVARRFFQAVPVRHQSDRYLVWLPGDFFRTVAAKRAPGTETIGSGYKIDNSPTYFCDVWGVHHDIPLADLANADDAFNLEVDAQAFVIRQLLLREEKLFMTQYMSPGVWSGFQYSGSTVDFAPNTHGYGYWDSDTSNPMKDVDSLRKGIMAMYGMAPNKMIISQNVYFALRNHPLVLDRIKYTERAVIDDTSPLARLFGIDEILVAGAVINTAQEGQPDAMQFMSNNSFLLGYVPPSPGLRTPAAGYRFSWTAYPGAGLFGNVIDSWDIREIKSRRVEGEMAFCFAQVSKSLAVFGTNVLQRP